MNSFIHYEMIYVIWQKVGFRVVLDFILEALRKLVDFYITQKLQKCDFSFVRINCLTSAYLSVTFSSENHEKRRVLIWSSFFSRLRYSIFSVRKWETAFCIASGCSFEINSVISPSESLAICYSSTFTKCSSWDAVVKIARRAKARMMAAFIMDSNINMYEKIIFSSKQLDFKFYSFPIKSFIGVDLF